MDNSEIIGIVKEIKRDLILIPGGSFLMGSLLKDKYAPYDELPQHLVHIQSFLIGKYPVTQRQWKAISSLSKVNVELESHPFYDKGNNLPVSDITWHEALEFCNRLSIFMGLNITLPSESQWEYTCRAGTTTEYYWGDNPNPDLANYDYNKDLNSVKPTLVGSYPPNLYGLYDMHGNVDEWCLDEWHYNYEGAPSDDRPWLDNNSNTERVVRGGSYHDVALNCRSTSRFGIASTAGLRICCSI